MAAPPTRAAERLTGVQAGFCRGGAACIRTGAVLAALLAALLQACGGGGGGGDEQPTVVEHSAVQRAAIGGEAVRFRAADLGAATAASYEWRQLSGPQVTLETPTAASVSFPAPDVAVTAKLRFELRAADVNGDTEVTPVELTVVNEAQVLQVPDDSYFLDARSASGSCRAPPPPPPTSPVVLNRVFADIDVTGAVDMDQAPGDGSSWYVTYIFERQVRRFANHSDAATAKVVLDLSAEPGRLRSIAFHPQFADNGKLYVHMHDGAKLAAATTVREYTWSPALDAFDPASERLILSVDSPQQRIEDGEHPGGNMHFGPDGYLYTALGDGTQPGLFNEFSQNTDTLWGSLLRIDVDGGAPYAIPPDNPFADGGGRPEIFAWGFRHPWKWSFDRDTGDIWLADVGYVSREEVNRVVSGGNYGWPLREGSAPCTSCELEKISVEVAPTELIDPVVDYGRDTGRSITGGYVYRGTEIPDLQGVYLFGDFIAGRVFALRSADAGGYTQELLAEAPIGVVAFAEDLLGEIYVLDFSGGGIYQLAGNDAAPASDFPALLSQTGCVDMADPERAVAGMIPFTVQVPLWSDGAAKSRWLALPEGATIGEIADSGGDLQFPPGTVLVKHFRLFNRLVETRLLMRHENGDWAGYSYEWNDSETEAVLLPGARNREVEGQQWRYPARAECLQCHTAAAGRVLGPTTRQLNTFQEHGERLHSQLQMWEELGLFSFEPDHSLVFAAQANEDAAVAERARAYLDVNCAGCHRPNGGGGRSTMDLRVDTPLAEMSICDAPPLVDTLGNPRARLLRPGEPDNSIILSRISHQNARRMPPIGSNLPDTAAVGLIGEWIASMESCE